MPPDVISTAIDPDGRSIVLTEERWRHIVDAHPELGPHRDAVMRAVRKPTEVIEGGAEDELWFYLVDAGPSRWLKVVVILDRPGGGRIITSFARRRKP